MNFAYIAGCEFEIVFVPSDEILRSNNYSSTLANVLFLFYFSLLAKVMVRRKK